MESAVKAGAGRGKGVVPGNREVRRYRMLWDFLLQKRLQGEKVENGSIDLSRCLYIVKALAIVSVVSAHCRNVPAEYSFANRTASVWLGYCGTAGVPVFYLLAGYFFENNSRPWREFWKNKWITVAVPWIFCATVLLALYAVFFYLKKYACFLWGAVAVSLVSIVGLGWGAGFRLSVNTYLDPVNWMGYFALGILLGRVHGMAGLLQISRKILPFTAACYLGVCWSHFYWDISWTYWSPFAVINIGLQVLLCFGCAACLSDFGQIAGMFANMGKVSYTIFLCHQLLVGAFVHITNRFDCFLLTLLRPLAVVAVWAYRSGAEVCHGSPAALPGHIEIDRPEGMTELAEARKAMDDTETVICYNMAYAWLALPGRSGGACGALTGHYWMRFSTSPTERILYPQYIEQLQGMGTVE